MKLTLGLAVVAALTLATVRSAEAHVGKVQISADKFYRRAETDKLNVGTDAVVNKDDTASKQLELKGQHDPKYDATITPPLAGKNVIDLYLKGDLKDLPKSKDVRDVFGECRWCPTTKAWLDKHGINCYFSPNYKYHTYSPAKMFNYAPGACQGEPDRPGLDLASHAPDNLIGVPAMYFNNNYERRCSVRVMVKVPAKNGKPEHWVLAWLVEHDIGPWTKKGDDNSPGAVQQGVLLSKPLYTQFLGKSETDTGTLPVEVEWFFPDINTL